jgi:hypothetical protein
MKLNLVLLTSLIISTSGHANTIFDMNNPIGDFLRKAKSNWSGSSGFSGVVESLSEEECYENLEDLIDDNQGLSLLEVSRFTMPIGQYEITGDLSKKPSSSKQLKLGVQEYTSLQNNTYSPENAIHIQPGCYEYVQIESVEDKRNMTLKYPVYIDGKRDLSQSELKTKECRVTNISLRDLNYEVIACEGNNYIYARY